MSLGALACLLAALLVITWWSLESSGVAVVTTQSEGDPRSTHVWYVQDAEALLIEAGTPENPWFRDIQVNPRVVIQAPGLSGKYLAEPLPNPSGHDRVRSLLREKYGVRDWWVALLFDTSESVAVEMKSVEP